MPCAGTGRGDGPTVRLALVVLVHVAYTTLAWPYWLAVATAPAPWLIVALDKKTRPWAVWAALAGCLAGLGLWGACAVALAMAVWPRSVDSFGGRLLAPIVRPTRAMDETQCEPENPANRPDACALRSCGVLRDDHGAVMGHEFMTRQTLSVYAARHRTIAYRVYWRPWASAPPIGAMLDATETIAVGGWNRSKGRLWIETDSDSASRFKRALETHGWGDCTETHGPMDRGRDVRA